MLLVLDPLLIIVVGMLQSFFVNFVKVVIHSCQ
jgi:hypothetical protein